MAFRRLTLVADRQCALLRRWSADPEVHPHEAVVGLAALLHGATMRELHQLTDADNDHDAPTSDWVVDHTRCRWTLDVDRTTTLHQSPPYVGSNNSHLLITMQDQGHPHPVSDGYVKNTLRAVGIQPRILRSTRLVVSSAQPMTNSSWLHTAYATRPSPPTSPITSPARLPNP